MNPHTYYLDLFKVAKPQLETIAATALAHGGDYADLYFEHTTFFNLLLKDGVVSSGGFHTDYGVGIRVLKGERQKRRSPQDRHSCPKNRGVANSIQ